MEDPYCINLPFPLQSKSPLSAVNWLRVVLDEGHIIRNPNAQMSKAVLELKAQRRWILSGMLIHTGCDLRVLFSPHFKITSSSYDECLNSMDVQTTLMMMHPCRYSDPEQREGPVDVAGIPAPEAL